MAQAGTHAAFKMDNASDVLTEVAVAKSSEIGFALDTQREDDTRFGDEWMAEDTILKSANGSLAMRWDTTLAKMYYDIFGDQKDFQFDPTGVNTGDIRHTGKFLVGGIDAPVSVSGQLMLNISFGPAGAIATAIQ